MNANSSPDGMITVEKFSEMKGLTTAKVIAMIKDGFYVGRIIDEQWYVAPSEASNGNQKTNQNTGQVSYSSDYEMARKVSKFISFFGWLVFGVGILVALIGLSNDMENGNRYGGVSATSLLALLPGIGIAISGLFLIAAAQVTRATVDNADHTREILKAITNRA